MTMPLGIDLGGYSRRRRRGAVIAPFSPSQLFASNEQGLWLDPSDTSTMFQNSTGTTPVTGVEQAVGLALDKSKGGLNALGPEKIQNGDFSNGTANWVNTSGTFTVSGGVASLTGVIVFTGQSFTTVVGRWYRATGTILSTSSYPGAFGGIRKADDATNTVNVVNINTTTGAPATNLTVSTYFVATSTTTWINIQVNNGTINVDNISVVEVPGNHVSQSTDARRPILRARYNLLTRTEEFNDATWDKAARVTVTANTTETTDPLGGNTADKITEVAVSGTHRVLQTITTTQNTTWVLSCYVKKGTRRWVWLDGSVSKTGQGQTDIIQFFDLDNAVLGQQVTTQQLATVTATFVSAAITDVGNGWRRCSITFTSQNTPTDVSVVIGLSNADGTTSYAGAITEYVYLWGADLRVANDGVGLPVYQRVGVATDYDTVGFPPYLAFDGVDDCLFTASTVDFTATDEMTVCAGVRKLLDVGTQLIAELSPATTNRRYSLGGFLTGTSRYFSSSGGTLLSGAEATNAALTAPVSNVMTGIGDISGDVSKIRANGVEQASNTADQGTGNYPNDQLFVGARNNAQFRFNGRLYGLLIRGRTTATPTLEQTETWMNGKTKAY